MGFAIKECSVSREQDPAASLPDRPRWEDTGGDTTGHEVRNSSLRRFFCFWPPPPAGGRNSESRQLVSFSSVSLPFSSFRSAPLRSAESRSRRERRRKDAASSGRDSEKLEIKRCERVEDESSGEEGKNSSCACQSLGLAIVGIFFFFFFLSELRQDILWQD